MKKILVIGGGAMGSAFTIPCIEKKNDVYVDQDESKVTYAKKILNSLKIKERSMKILNQKNLLLLMQEAKKDLKVKLQNQGKVLEVVQ